MTLLEQAKDYLAIADALAEELAKSAVERDLRAGAPDEEIDLLRQTIRETSRRKA
jgi:hypothetical protein